MEIHLDCLGGLAGDMFVACLLDAFPEHRAEVIERAAALAPHFAAGAPPCRVFAWSDGIFAGSRFEVPAEPPAAGSTRPPARVTVHRHAAEGQHSHGEPRHSPGGRPQTPDEHTHPPEAHSHAHDGHPQAHHGHLHAPDGCPAAPDEHLSAAEERPHTHADGHVAWANIRQQLQQVLPPGILRHSLGIFEQLAMAEAAVHGVAVDAVEFHEVGAWDSVVDIVAAATLIDRLDARRWTVSALPLGSGRIRTAHGWMPVPPPATALLLRGFATIDDGIPGERVTPTGAAILKYLLPEGHPPSPATGATGAARAATADVDAANSARAKVTGTAMPRPSRVLRRAGVGFGSRRLAGISNCVRLLAFDTTAAGASVAGSLPSLPSPALSPIRGPEGADAAGVCLPAAPAAAHRELAVVEFEVDDQSAEELSTGLDRLRAHQAVFDVVQAPVFGKKGRIMTSVRLLASPSALAEVIDACFQETTTIGLRHSVVRGAALPRSFAKVTVDGHALRVKLVQRPGGFTTAKAESDDALAHETHEARRRIRREAERLALQQPPVEQPAPTNAIPAPAPMPAAAAATLEGRPDV